LESLDRGRFVSRIFLFDIVKPPPARGLQRLGGGLGILIDDLIAGAMALAVVQILFRFVLVA
jgi:phosphatidylglycerophosphatase A